VIERIGPEQAIMEEETRELPYGWYFLAQSKRYLQTRDFSDMLVGSGGYLVVRETGRLFAFGSGRPLDDWLALYERGVYDPVDLTVLAVHDLDTTVRLLYRLDMGYVLPEVEHGVEWRIPRSYSRPELRERLSRLPCTFEGQSLWDLNALNELDASGCCTYRVNARTSYESE
jgi:hypothetical protein